MKTIHIISILTLLLCSCNFDRCRNGNCDHDYIYIVKHWTGKEIEIPDSYTYQIKDDTIVYDIDNADYKIITYIDSTGCHTCHMQLDKWDKALGQLKSIPDISVNFAMILNSPDNREMYRILKTSDFRNPVVFDRDGLFAHVNTLPVDESCRTFLLDADNRILAIGNPALNPKTLELYMKIINGEGTGDETSADNMQISLCADKAKPLGLVSVGDSVIIDYELHNETGRTVHIQDIVPSCGCIKAVTFPDSIPQGEYALIEISVAPTEPSADYQQQIDIFYKEAESPETLNVYGFVK
ncbi:MAG: DUF1573 domain-containing protein [Duncaniella sp.]|nr:DUF1573 domain-containing protein [Duncaniella sp.]